MSILNELFNIYVLFCCEGGIRYTAYSANVNKI